MTDMGANEVGLKGIRVIELGQLLSMDEAQRNALAARGII